MTIDRAIEILNPEHRENYDGMAEVNEACRMGMEALERTRWIPCSERMPEPETEVLVVCRRGGFSFVCPAMHENGKMLRGESTWNWNEIEGYGLYSEEADDWFIPEGWWEYRQFNDDDVYNNIIDCAVTHWMPMPEPPKEVEFNAKE